MHDAIRKQVTVPLPPADAFDLFTRGIDDWWPRRGRLRDRPGARLRLDPSGDLREEAPGRPARPYARVTVWEPGRRLVLTWTEGHRDDEEPSEVEVRFVPVDAGTRVEVTHASLVPFGDPGWASALRTMAQAVRRASASRLPAASTTCGKVTASR